MIYERNLFASREQAEKARDKYLAELKKEQDAYQHLLNNHNGFNQLPVDDKRQLVKNRIQQLNQL